MKKILLGLILLSSLSAFGVESRHRLFVERDEIQNHIKSESIVYSKEGGTIDDCKAEISERVKELIDVGVIFLKYENCQKTMSFMQFNANRPIFSSGNEVIRARVIYIPTIDPLTEILMD